MSDVWVLNNFEQEYATYALQNRNHCLVEVFDLVVCKGQVLQSANLGEAFQLPDVIVIQDKSLKPSEAFNSLRRAINSDLERIITYSKKLNATSISCTTAGEGQVAIAAILLSYLSC